ncbi:MAG TPA: DUF6256 family protein [Actinomycetota bacterium]
MTTVWTMATAGRIAGQVVIPTLFAYVLFLVALWLGARGKQEHRPASAPPVNPHDWGRLVRLLLVTALAGYVGLLVIVLVFYLALGGQGPHFLSDALTGGAFMAFAVAVPGFLGIELLRSIRARFGPRDTSEPD